MLEAETIGLALSWVGTACWVACFWWMHRISSRQDSLIKELHEITMRIEQLSKEGHELVQEVHPVVGEIKQKVVEVAEAISEQNPEQKPPG